MSSIGLVKKLVAQTNEFERTPIPDDQLKGNKSFLGMYAGEHTAGTEFVIGVLGKQTVVAQMKRRQNCIRVM